jgi:hypothetical protein
MSSGVRVFVDHGTGYQVLTLDIFRDFILSPRVLENHLEKVRSVIDIDFCLWIVISGLGSAGQVTQMYRETVVDKWTVGAKGQVGMPGN